MRYVAPPADDLLSTAEPACVFTTWEGVAQCAIDRLDALRQANGDKVRARTWVEGRQTN